MPAARASHFARSESSHRRVRRAYRIGLYLGVFGTATAVVSAAPGCLIPITTNPVGADGGGIGVDAGYADTPIPPGAWKNVSYNLANLPSICGNLTFISNKPDEDMLIAGVGNDGLWALRDGGSTWQQLGTGGTVTIPNRPSAVVFDPVTTTRFWESGIYGDGAGVFVTNDDGNTFVSLGLHHNDLISVDFGDPLRKTLAVGGHEITQTFWLSTDGGEASSDGGQAWNNVGTSLPAKATCTFPQIINQTTFLLGCGEFGSTGIYGTTNSGANWTYLTASGGYGQPLVATDLSIYWPTAVSGLVRGFDGGQSWTEIATPSNPNTIRWIELPDARLATIGTVYGAQTVLVSADHGQSWAHASAVVPYTDASDVVYSPQEKAFFISHVNCTGTDDGAVPADVVQRFDWDYTKN